MTDHFNLPFPNDNLNETRCSCHGNFLPSYLALSVHVDQLQHPFASIALGSRVYKVFRALKLLRCESLTMFRCIALFTLFSVVSTVFALPSGSMSCPLDSHYCDGTNHTSDVAYICGDSRLGPSFIPNLPPLDRLFEPYVPLGGLCPSKWIDLYVNKTMPRYLVFPPVDGYQIISGSKSNQTINGTVTLSVGSLIDRFGAETGRFVSPIGTPFAQRGLYPSSLNTVTASVQFNYRVYNVTQEFEVSAGPIAPAFGQPGQGVQYHTEQSVAHLVKGGYLARVTPRA